MVPAREKIMKDAVEKFFTVIKGIGIYLFAGEKNRRHLSCSSLSLKRQPAASYQIQSNKSCDIVPLTSAVRHYI
jgi:hypothetical protein